MLSLSMLRASLRSEALNSPATASYLPFASTVLCIAASPALVVLPRTLSISLCPASAARSALRVALFAAFDVASKRPVRTRSCFLLFESWEINPCACLYTGFPESLIDIVVPIRFPSASSTFFRTFAFQASETSLPAFLM